MKPENKFSIVLLCICLLPLTVLADAGTPLMWAGMLHLLFGNALIGIFEGFILAKFFKQGLCKCVMVMILANYFSSWSGVFFLAKIISPYFYNALDLYNAWFWFWVMVVVTFVLTLIVEWPFVFFCLRKTENRFSKSLRGNLLVNSISYVLLFGWYWSASGTGIYRQMEVVRPDQMTLPTNGVVYFISVAGGNVCSLDFKTLQLKKVFALNIQDMNDRLLVKPSVSTSNSWNIFNCRSILISSNLDATAVEFPRDTERGSDHGTMFNFGNAAKLGAAERSDWTFQCGFWPIEGLRGENMKTGAKLYFSWETPFIAWNVRNATHLPGDYVVFQLGEGQICILETMTKKIALLAKGYGPVVLLPRY